MAELSESILITIAVLITAGVVWKIMSERAARMVEEAMSQSKVEVATTEARLGALTDEKGTMQKQMQNAFEVAAANAFKTAVDNADQEKVSSFSVATKQLADSMNDYIKQEHERGKEGEKGKRADFILNLPDNRQVVIDSKVSLTAYTEYVNAEDEDASTSAMKAHCRSIRSHAEKLASKNYEQMEGFNTPDFVLMVVPLEGAFIDAMRSDHSLYGDLVEDRRVKIVSGSSFMLALLLIQELWKRENQSRNQIKLVERGGHLHDKVVTFLESFTTVGFELGQAKAAYDEAETQLTSGTGNVIRQTEMLRDLGAKVKKDLRGKSGVRLLAEEAEEE